MVEYYQPTEGEAHGILAFASGRIADFEVPRVREAGEEHCYQPSPDWLGQFVTRLTGKNLPTLLRELILAPIGATEDEMTIQNSKIKGKEISGFHVRGPGGDQGPEYINIPFGIYQSESDDPPEGQAHFASAALYTTVPLYASFLRAVSGCLLFSVSSLESLAQSPYHDRSASTMIQSSSVRKPGSSVRRIHGPERSRCPVSVPSTCLAPWCFDLSFFSVGSRDE